MIFDSEEITKELTQEQAITLLENADNLLMRYATVITLMIASGKLEENFVINKILEETFVWADNVRLELGVEGLIEDD